MKGRQLWPFLVTFAALTATIAQADWNPRPGWQDSYAVGGTCYCNSSNYDHNLDRKSADTPIGRLNVVQICADIKAVVGTGPSSGRIPYNDIQCGNGPANDAADEAGCPGRVDQGSSGCDQIGPKWPLEQVYGAWPDGTVTPPPAPPAPDGDQEVGVRASASDNPSQADMAIDGSTRSRWTTRRYQRPGQVFALDLGSPQTVGKLVLDATRSQDDTPAGYSVSTSMDGKTYDVVATGTGGRGSTTIEFANRPARHIRITQTGSKRDRWWSIHELTVSKGSDDTPAPAPAPAPDPDPDPPVIAPESSEKLPRSNWTTIASDNAGDASAATDGSARTRWTTRRAQTGGQWFEIDLSKAESVSRVVLDTSKSRNDYPRRYVIRVSTDGSSWKTVASGTGQTVTDIGFGTQRARYVRIEQSGINKSWWSIHDVNIYR